MTNILFYTPEGEITSWLTVPEFAVDSQIIPEGLSRLVTDEPVTGETHYVKNNQLVAKPPKPQGNMRFDIVSEQWEVIPDPIPKVISMRQARLQLLALGLLDDVESQLTQLPRSSQIEWEYATEVKIDNQLVLQLQGLLNMTNADLDAFFLEASKL